MLDATGTILAVNEAWKRFAAANGFNGEGHGVGLNYLHICDAAGAHQDASHIGQGIRHILDGTIRAFSYEYESSSPFLRRWFRVIVTPLQGHQSCPSPTIPSTINTCSITFRRIRKRSSGSAAR
ncbi:hypothetical protein FBQ96_00740 [Nitrospirales bacterium NOB]|nr:MAG: putative histidine kinase [Nitrospira sp. OLB3]MCE7965040.1 hypothetical protein [Nitrospira sp. NTP2]MCK6492838.1 hypothetical protein [Nitrospira sp.]MDL1888107.1 hypothetical protein [Nitrospirales bacterium NOB]MEB2337890.1 hypothetical protein [Nitrospirales bacterium]